VTERGPREALWRDCERWWTQQQGGFFRRQPGGQRDGHITENAQMGLEAFVAAMDAMLTPEGEQVTLLKTSDPALNEVPAVQRWLQHASDRLHACRNAAHTGFHRPTRCAGACWACMAGAACGSMNGWGVGCSIRRRTQRTVHRQ
jgi:hypothetical protein